MADVLHAFPIEEADIPVCASYAEAAASGRLARISLGAPPAYRKPGDVVAREEFAFLLPRGRLVVLKGLCVALTEEGGFIPASFPKTWPYARYRLEAGLALPIEAPPLRLDGDWAAPFTQPDLDHLYHSLLDNYGRLAWLDALKLDLPILFPSIQPPTATRDALSEVFLTGRKVGSVEAGVFECGRLLLPPPGNRDDRYCPLVAQFLRARLRAAFGREGYSHKTRLYVSRADARVRKVMNEGELIEALRPRGFLPLCPGDYSLAAQFEIFGAAEAIFGVHGAGLTPLLAARDCRRLIEIEALGWKGTAYSGLAGALGMEYRRIGGELLPGVSGEGTHWLARVDVDEALAALDGY